MYLNYKQRGEFFIAVLKICLKFKKKNLLLLPPITLTLLGETDILIFVRVKCLSSSWLRSTLFSFLILPLILCHGLRPTAVPLIPNSGTETEMVGGGDTARRQRNCPGFVSLWVQFQGLKKQNRTKQNPSI